MKKVQNYKENDVNSIRSIVKANLGIIQAELNQILQQYSKILEKTSPNEFLKLWFENNSDERSRYILSGQQEIFNFSQKQQKFASNFNNINQILEVAKFLDGVYWHFKITNKFSQNICSTNQHSIKILAYLKTILQGYFSNIDKGAITKVIDIEPLSITQAYFQTKTEEGFTLFWEVAIDKVPKLICKNKLNINEIVGFNLHHTITFIDIKYETNLDKDVKLIIQNYHNETKNSYYRKGIDSNLVREILEEIQYDLNKEYLFIRQNNSIWELTYNLRKNEIVKWLGLKFQPIILTQQEQESFEFDSQSSIWVSKNNNYGQIFVENQQKQMESKKDLILKLADFSSSYKLVEFLQKVPNFSIKLTEEQKQIIGTEGKIVFTGRSGTGKTTCLILRLLAMDFLFKLRLDLYSRKNPQIDIDDLFMSCIFISNNNLMSFKAKNYYQKLKNQIKSELDKKQQKQISLHQTNPSFLQRIQQDQYRYQIKAQNSFYDLIYSDQPLFLIIQEVIFLIDSSLNKPFFSQNTIQDKQFRYNSIRENYREDSVEKIQRNELYMDQIIDKNEDINFKEFIQEQQMQEQHNLDYSQEIGEITKQQEVDFTFFLNNFWLKKFPNLNLNPHFIWTQIYSHIKGSSNSHEYPDHCIPMSIFLQANNNKKEFNQVYEIFIQYEKWRVSQGYYDLLDVVNHILVQFKYDQIHIPPIHHLIIDEIQDLPQALVLLFEKISLLGTIYSGDTAQNVCRGAGFRFLTIQDFSKQLVSKDEYQYCQQDLSLQNLKQNFRSNSNILSLANSVVSLIEIYFPKTIDSLKKEQSNFEGIKPIIINGSLDLLFYLFEGLINSENNNQTQKLPIEIGYNSVVIVKNSESKKNVPKLFQHILILSIDEAKGLEFENVILYNFFTDTSIGQLEWKQLQTCEILDEEINKQSYSSSYTKDSIIDYYTSYFTGYDDKNGNNLIKRMKSYINYYDEFSYDNSGLCNELKQLYIAITRTRQCLYIFDEKPQVRNQIEIIWKNLQLVQILDYPNFNHQNFQSNLKIKSKKEWQEQGICMFKKKLYQQAEKCFLFSEDQNLQKKALGFKLSTEGLQLILKYQQQSQKYLKLKDKNQYLQKLKQKYLDMFYQAAQVFYDNQNLKQAAQCFYYSEQYEKACQLYDTLELFYEAGESAFKCQNYTVAAQFFLKCNDFTKTIDSFEKANEFEYIIQVLYQQKNQIDSFITTEFFNKFLPILQKKMTYEIQNQSINEYKPNSLQSFQNSQVRNFQNYKQIDLDQQNFVIEENNKQNFEEDQQFLSEVDLDKFPQKISLNQ